MAKNAQNEPEVEKPEKSEKLDEEQIEQEQIKSLADENPVSAEHESEPPVVVVSHHTSGNIFKRCGRWVKAHKKISIPLIIVLLLAILAAIPWTRFSIAGLFLKQNFTVIVLDAQTNKPVSATDLRLHDQHALTNGQGKATLHTKVGTAKLQITKSYYKSVSQNVTVPFLKQKHELTVRLTATGRQIPVTVQNKITGKPIEGATVTAEKSQAKTDKNGQATLVVSADKPRVTAKITAAGFNDNTYELRVTGEKFSKDILTLTPSGKVYFLSNKSGTIDVVKTDLDGVNRKTVLAGTGKENRQNTVLLAARDWKYLALLSEREGTQKLYLIDTSSDSLVTIDEGTDVSFNPIGWSGDTFIYTVARQKVTAWQPNASAIKSYNASNKKMVTLDQTAGAGTDQNNFVRSTFGNVYILPDNQIVYDVNWETAFYTTGQLSDKQASLSAVKADGSDKKALKGFPVPNGTNVSSMFLQSRSYKPNALYFRPPFASDYYEYEDGQVNTTKEVNDQTFYDAYPTYLWSPSGQKTFWSESRDGKNALFIGDQDGENKKQIATLSEYQVYGWYTDNYVLISRGGSELSIMPASGGTPIVIADYYKPAINYKSYGGGYGGL